MKAYVVVKGETQAAILRALLPASLLEEAALVPAGERSTIVSVARTLLVTRRKPVALLRNSDSNDEGMIQERMQITKELLNMAAAGIPTRVIPLIPHMEAIFFQAPGLIEKLFGEPIPGEVRVL